MDGWPWTDMRSVLYTRKAKLSCRSAHLPKKRAHRASAVGPKYEQADDAQINACSANIPSILRTRTPHALQLARRHGWSRVSV